MPAAMARRPTCRARTAIPTCVGTANLEVVQGNPPPNTQPQVYATTSIELTATAGIGDIGGAWGPATRCPCARPITRRRLRRGRARRLCVDGADLSRCGAVHGRWCAAARAVATSDGDAARNRRVHEHAALAAIRAGPAGADDRRRRRLYAQAAASRSMKSRRTRSRHAAVDHGSLRGSRLRRRGVHDRLSPLRGAVGDAAVAAAARSVEGGGDRALADRRRHARHECDRDPHRRERHGRPRHAGRLVRVRAGRRDRQRRADRDPAQWRLRVRLHVSRRARRRPRRAPSRPGDGRGHGPDARHVSDAAGERDRGVSPDGVRRRLVVRWQRARRGESHLLRWLPHADVQHAEHRRVLRRLATAVELAGRRPARRERQRPGRRRVGPVRYGDGHRDERPGEHPVAGDEALDEDRCRDAPDRRAAHRWAAGGRRSVHAAALSDRRGRRDGDRSADRARHERPRLDHGGDHRRHCECHARLRRRSGAADQRGAADGLGCVVDRDRHRLRRRAHGAVARLREQPAGDLGDRRAVRWPPQHRAADTAREPRRRRSDDGSDARAARRRRAVSRLRRLVGVHADRAAAAVSHAPDQRADVRHAASLLRA